MKDIYKLEIGINFLKMKVNFDNFSECFGHMKFPLYKLKWFVDQEEKYYFDNNNIISSFFDKKKFLGQKKNNEYMSIEKLLDKSQKIKKPFEILFKSSMVCFLGLIQKNISIFGKTNYKISKNNEDIKNLTIQIPNHIQKSLHYLFFSNLCLNKVKLNSSKDSFSQNDSKKNYQLKQNNKSVTNYEKNKDNNEENLINGNIINNLEDNSKEKASLQFEIALENENIKEEKIKLTSNMIKNSNLNFHVYNEPNNSKKNKYSEFINKTTISFPKKPTSSFIKKKTLKDLEEEPFFTESNFNTNNNNISSQADNSTKISASTNIKTFSKYGEKNNFNNEESALDSLLGSNNSLTLKNQINTLKSNNNISVEMNNKILFNFEEKEKKISRNNKRNKLINKSWDNDHYKCNDKNDEMNIKERKRLEIKSYDNIFYNKIKFNDDFVPFKTKDKLIYKHVNIITDKNTSKNFQKMNILPSFKFESINYSRFLNYTKLSNDPKYMYIDYYHNNEKVHKSKLFDFNY